MKYFSSPSPVVRPDGSWAIGDSRIIVTTPPFVLAEGVCSCLVIEMLLMEKKKFLSALKDKWGPCFRAPSTTRRLLTTDLVILNHGQVARTPKEASSSPKYHTTPTLERFKPRQRKWASAPSARRGAKSLNS
ncbi:hypothetical protein TNCV_4358451 [Trichonephila clavipes]|nr:hypothetical protein TNCV_4358451 [Trichonephila clavipes]